MERHTIAWLSGASLIALAALGLGIAALVVALDDDDPGLPLASGAFGRFEARRLWLRVEWGPRAPGGLMADCPTPDAQCPTRAGRSIGSPSSSGLPPAGVAAGRQKRPGCGVASDSSAVTT